MICAACGTTMLAGAKFCAECGTPARAACRECGTELSAGQKFCPECGTPTVSTVAGRPPAVTAAAPAEVPGTSAPVAERRVTSVLFGDLVGFTSLSEERDPEEVRELLGRYFDTAREIVARYGGTIEKFIGDAVMAVWGVPIAHEDDAERAVRAGLDLAERVTAFGEAVGAPGLAMRVGVVTGEVAVTLGAAGQGMVAGDAVNTAARVQSRAEPGKVWVDDQTRSLASGSIDFEPTGVHELKGKAEPIALFAATSVRGGVRGERSSDRVQAPLVGRRRELSVLKEMFHVAAEEHRPRLVILSGDAGIGKTRLSWELENYIDGLSATVLWHRGRCLAYGDGVAFSALTAAVRGRIGAADDDTEAATRDKLLRSLETYVADDSERARILPALANLLGLPGGSELTRADLFSAWLTWFERLSQTEDEAVVWVVDDAHYADDGLLDFIEHLSTVAQVPMLIVLLTRAELLGRRPGLATLRRATVIGLETLSRTDVGALLDGLVEGLPADVRDALVVRAEGNPLFAIETVRAMNDQGLTVGGPTRTPGAVRLATGVDAATLSELAAPTSLQVLIASRLDLLPPAARSVLAAASVLGQTFSVDALAAISGSTDDLPAVVRELITRDLLTTVTDRLSAEEGQYAFVQAVVRTVAYQTQSRRDRLQRHLAVADHLEFSADSDSQLSTVIAQHLHDAVALMGSDDSQRGEVRARLRHWLERSAERSLAVGAPLEAAHVLNEALAFADDPADAIRLHLAAAEAALAAGAPAVCIEHARPIATGELAAERADVARAATAAASALRVSGEFGEGWALLEPYLADSLDDLPIRTATNLSRQMGIYLDSTARFDEGLIWTERALRLSEDAGDPRLIAQCLSFASVAFMLRGNQRLSGALLDLSASVAREHGLVFDLALPLLNQVAVQMNRDPAAALAAGVEAMTLFEQSGSIGHCWHTALNQAIVLTAIGDWDEVSRLFERPLLREQPPTPVQNSITAFEVAVIASARGEAIDLAVLDQAAAHSREGEFESADTLYFLAARAMHTRATGDVTALVATCHDLVETANKYIGLDDDFPHLWAQAVEWTIEAKHFDDARQLLAPVAEAPPTRWTPLLEAQLLRLRGTIAALDPASADDPATVEADLLAGIAALDAFGAVPSRARTEATLGLWLAGQGRSDDAAIYLAAARETFTALRATAWLRELDSALTLAATA